MDIAPQHFLPVGAGASSTNTSRSVDYYSPFSWELTLPYIIVVFYRRSLIALCLIIILHKDYIPSVHKRGKEGTYKVVYPPLPNCHGEALKVCTRVLEKLNFSAGAVRTSTLAEKLARLAKQEYDILSQTQHYNHPGVIVDTSFFPDLQIR